jgi:hypothetical protein
LLRENTPQMSFDSWKRRFNGIGALLARNDAAAQLLELYKTVDVKGHTQFRTDFDKGRYANRLLIIHTIISQDEIIGQMQPTQKKELLSRTLSNYDVMAADEVYGFFNHAALGRIIVKLAAVMGDQSVRSMTSSASIQNFIATGMVTDRDAFLQVIDKAKAIAGK